MRDADDEVAVLLRPEVIGNGLHGGNGVAEAHALAGVGGYEALELRRDRRDANLQPGPAHNGVGLHESFHRRAREIIVAAYDGEVGLAEEARHIVEPEVEFVVAYRGGVIAHEVHQSHLYFAVVEAIVGRALREVAGIYEEQVGVGLSEIIDECHAPQVASLVGIGSVGEQRAEGFNARVGIVGVDEHQRPLSFLPLGGRRDLYLVLGALFLGLLAGYCVHLRLGGSLHDDATFNLCRGFQAFAVEQSQLIHERLAHGLLGDDALGGALQGVELVVAIGQIVESGDGVDLVGLDRLAPERGADELAVGGDDEACGAADAFAADRSDIVHQRFDVRALQL